ncbi:MAG: DUF2950 family protein, partial [Planctomycetota bacterium]
AIIAIIAAIAIPNLLESKKAANETNAVGSLKSIASGMEIYKTNNYSAIAANGGDGTAATAKCYPTSWRGLGGAAADQKMTGEVLTLVPPTIGDAVDVNSANQGFYFNDIASDNLGNAYNVKYGWGAGANPAVYDKTGSNTFVIDVQGVVYQQDFGAVAEQAQFPDDPTNTGWVSP